MEYSVEPPRKRRRPAVACFECRRRKVKCDRNSPCAQCVQAGSATCTYSPDAARLSGKQQPGHTPLTPDSINGTSNILVQRFGSPVESANLDGAASVSTYHNSTLASSPNTVPLVEAPSWWHHDNRVSAAAVSNEALVGRIRRLEHKVAAANSSTLEHPVSEPVHVTFSKSRVFGRAHWMSYFHSFEKLRLCTNAIDLNDTSTFSPAGSMNEIITIVYKCKNAARAAKASRPAQLSTTLELQTSVPSREVSDQLLDLYFRNFESIYRILHIPTFKNEYSAYWKDPQAASTGFFMKFLIVMSIGTCFYRNFEYPKEETTLRAKALEWIYNAQSWLSSPLEKSILTLNCLQVHCLLLLARQVNSFGADLVWISAGSLLKMGMQMGLHRDPVYFPKMSILKAEMRRRLWATILELEVQSSLDSGMRPMISFDDFDTEPPSNYNDEQIDDTSEVIPYIITRPILNTCTSNEAIAHTAVAAPPPITVFTHTSLQIILYASLRTRLEIGRMMNNLRSEPAYEEVLRLSKLITAASRESAKLLQSYKNVAAPLSPVPTTFQCNVLDHLTRRFILSLHRPFTINALSDPRFYYSRKVSTELALALVSPDPDDDFTRLMTLGGGVFRETLTHGGGIIYLELITQLDEDDLELNRESDRARRAPLLAAARKLVEFSRERVRLGENNIKGHLFTSMALGHIEAMEAGTSVEEGIYEAARNAATACYDILRARITSAGDDNPRQAEKLQGLDSGGLGTGDDSEFEFQFLQDQGLDIEIPDSWFFTGWDENL